MVKRGGCAERSEGADGVARQLLLSCRATPPLRDLRGGECLKASSRRRELVQA